MQIVPIRDLKDTNKIYEKAQTAHQPIFVTKNGYGALVVMSIEAYERDFAAVQLRQKLAEAEAEFDSGVEPLDAKAVLRDLKAKYVK